MPSFAAATTVALMTAAASSAMALAPAQGGHGSIMQRLPNGMVMPRFPPSDAAPSADSPLVNPLRNPGFVGPREPNLPHDESQTIGGPPILPKREVLRPGEQPKNVTCIGDFCPQIKLATPPEADDGPVPSAGSGNAPRTVSKGPRRASRFNGHARTTPLEVDGHPVKPGFKGPRAPEPEPEPFRLRPGEQPLTNLPPGAVSKTVAQRSPEPFTLRPGEQPLTNLPPGTVSKVLARAVADLIEKRYLEEQLD